MSGPAFGRKTGLKPVISIRKLDFFCVRDDHSTSRTGPAFGCILYQTVRFLDVDCIPIHRCENIQNTMTLVHVSCIGSQYSFNLITGLVRYSNSNGLFVSYSNGLVHIQMVFSIFTILFPVRFSNGKTSLDEFMYKKNFLLYLKWSRLIDHLKTGPKIRW
jgi:hypothetical protein